MENLFIIKKTLLLIHEDGEVLDQFIKDYYHFFNGMDRVGNNMLQITSSIDAAEAKELITEGKLIVLESDYNHEADLTLDKVLDKINDSNHGIDSLSFNERMVLYSASEVALASESKSKSK